MGKDEATLMLECAAVIKSTETSLEDKIIALEDLELLVGQIDNARNLEPLKLWPMIFDLMEQDKAEELKKHGAWLCGTAVQNNPVVKKKFVELGGMEKMYQLMEVENGDDSPVRAKAVYCISGLLQNSPEYIQLWKERQGFELWVKILQSSSLKAAQLCGRIMFTLNALICQEQEQQQQQEGQQGENQLLPYLIDNCKLDAVVLSLVKETLVLGNEEDLVQKAVDLFGVLKSSRNSLALLEEWESVLIQCKSLYPELTLPA